MKTPEPDIVGSKEWSRLEIDGKVIHYRRVGSDGIEVRTITLLLSGQIRSSRLRLMVPMLPQAKSYEGVLSLTSTRRLSALTDFLPIATRKAVKAMLGDYDEQIRDLQAKGRAAAAQWNVCLAWMTAICIVLRSPVDLVLKYVSKIARGS